MSDLGLALDLSDDASERAGLLMRQAELSEAGARFEEATTAAEEARATYERLGDRSAFLGATALLGRIEMKSGRMVEAAALFEQSLSDLDPAADPATYARFAAEYARIHMVENRAAEGAAWTERALAAAGPIRLVEVVAEALNTRGVCLQYLNRLDEGVALLRASVDLAAANHLSSAELRARFNLAGRRFADDPRDAIEVLRTGVDVALKTGRRDWLLALSGFLSGQLTSSGTSTTRSPSSMSCLTRIGRPANGPTQSSIVPRLPRIAVTRRPGVRRWRRQRRSSGAIRAHNDNGRGRGPPCRSRSPRVASMTPDVRRAGSAATGRSGVRSALPGRPSGPATPMERARRSAPHCCAMTSG